MLLPPPARRGLPALRGCAGSTCDAGSNDTLLSQAAPSTARHPISQPCEPQLLVLHMTDQRTRAPPAARHAIGPEPSANRAA